MASRVVELKIAKTECEFKLSLRVAGYSAKVADLIWKWYTSQDKTCTF